MPPPPATDTSSPSASSLFLPLARRTRRDSKASLSPDLDQDALNQALDTIHTAASQSQVLTVFNEYTAPPSASKGDGKTLPEDLQGGLSGLYNKLRASVGANKEYGDTTSVPALQTSGHERAISKDSTGRTSNVQSPRSADFSPSHGHGTPTVPSKLSSKAPSVARTSGAASGLKSPTASILMPPHMLEGDTDGGEPGRPLVHSRTGSTIDASDHLQDPLNAEDGAMSLLQNTQSETNPLPIATSGHHSRITSPALVPVNHTLTAPNVLQETRDLESSQEQAFRKTVVSPAGPVLTGLERTRTNESRARSERAPPKSSSNPLDLLASHRSNPSKRATDAVSRESKSKAQNGNPNLQGNRPKDKLMSQVSQSRLPGYPVSRASSTDSGPTTAAMSIHAAAASFDGPSDSRVYQGASKPIKRMRSKLLNREFWMRDENARDCFHCGEPFTTFRRKHHCRTCGQIFDNKCTLLLQGSQFGSAGAIRVCKPCEALISFHDDDSSDYSDESTAIQETHFRPRTPELSSRLQRSPQLDDDNASVMSLSLEQMSKTPTMSFPVRRAYEGDRSSRIIEFDVADRPLPRPSSSRSLKASHSVGHGHRRNYSRHQHARAHKVYHDDRAPFQRRTAEDVAKDAKSSAFHRDSIIDPDLAQYLSDDASSGEEQSLSMNLHQEKSDRAILDPERSTIGGLLAAVRKGRSRIGERSIAGFLGKQKDPDEVSIVSSRGIDIPRPQRKRNLSVASSVHQRSTPRGTKERLQIVLPDGHEDASQLPTQPFVRATRMIRSVSMHGTGAPAMELNRASIQHVHRLLQQQLKDAGVVKVESWEEALVPILLKATDDVDPDVASGDDIDIRNYVKLKKVPGGRPGDTAYVSGLIFTKNVALKSMSRLVMQPRILIITFALEYARHEQHFMSLDPVIRQEREYLQNLVGRIAALKPDLLLAQKNVSGLALELLDKANIATIFNVKSSVLDAVSRCTQSRVVQSMDKLSAPSGQIGTCESFEVKTFVSDGRKKTYVYFSGCPPSLGCTIALRGADRKMLSKIKKITEFMIYVVYNLKLETCLMRDEWALIPSAPIEETVKPPPSDSKPGALSTDKRGLQPSAGLTAISDQNEKVDSPESTTDSEAIKNSTSDILTMSTTLESAESAEIPDDIPVPTFYEDMVDKHQTKILSASPFVKFMPPYLLMRARELERRVAYLKRLRDQDLSTEQTIDEKTKALRFTLIQPEMLHATLTGASKKVRDVIHAVHDTEYDKALYHYETQKKQWEAYLSGNKNLFDPYAHQNIVVLFSFVATATSVPCQGPDLLAFSFYNEHEQQEDFEADCTLGQYVEDLCFQANDACTAESCDRKMLEHHRQYVHGQAQISVFVQAYPSKMRGLQDSILMWSQCRVCGVETTVTPMSASTWKYSYGKYLELSFWSADLHARAGVCPHDLHRDHVRFFGFKDVAVRVQYDPIELLEIVVPRMRITWKVDNDLRFRNDVFTKIENRVTRFMGSVKLRLKGINAEAVLPEQAHACRAEIERLSKKANDEHTMLVKQLQERYTNSRHWEIIPLNKVIRSTQEKVAEWDTAFNEFEQNFLPSEKDIRRLATLQLKKIFLDRDVSVTSLTSDTEEPGSPPPEQSLDEKAESPPSDDEKHHRRRSTVLSPEKAQHVLQSVLEEHSADGQEVSGIDHDEILLEKEIQQMPEFHEGSGSIDDVQHLDLAVDRKPTRDAGHSRNPSSTADVSKAPLESTNPPNAGPAVTPSTLPAIAGDSDAPNLLTPGIPIALPSNRRTAAGGARSPVLVRAQSQPVGAVVLQRPLPSAQQTTSLAIGATHGFGSGAAIPSVESKQDAEPGSTKKKLSEQLGLSQLKNSKFVKSHSFIPRAISNRKESRVSNLAKHFEQLSREFERERVRERKLRAARSRYARVHPLPISKPIVEVYKDVDEAVDEPNSSDDIFDLERSHTQEVDDFQTADSTQAMDPPPTGVESFHTDETPADAADTDADTQLSSHAPSDTDDHSDDDLVAHDIQLPDSPEDLLRLSQEDIDLKELPKHERSSLMKLLTNFWAERSASGWSALEYPLGPSEHVFADCDIVVREDEPSSIIAFALESQDYKTMLHDIQDHNAPFSTGVFGHSHEDTGDMQADVMHSLLRKTGTHLKYQFQEGPAKMLCKVFFAEQFDAVRRKCGVADRIVESLSRCLKWDSKGGKTKSLFLKTLDDRFVLKSLSPIETQSFLKFAPNYFQIMSEAFFHELPSVIAKMLGFYQIIIKNPATGVEYNWYLLVMENLFYDRTPTRIFDLKGSMRNRKINATGERNEVLLDENMVEFIYESPLFAREHSKKLLRSSVHNDTLFLARQNVMDYSLMIAIDEKRKELVVGIIDCIRTYTWDKKLESWIKDRGFGGGGRNKPTVTSPKEYKRRFREAMGRYVLEAPNCWHQVGGGGLKDYKVEKWRDKVDKERRESLRGVRMQAMTEDGEQVES